jgi:NAD(P)-dependent dehydrogenase (short-subunit alcohol dehydrogenase family)
MTAVEKPATPADLKGNVALVTGAASGIGLAAARRLRAAGARIAVLDLDEDLGVAAAVELGGHFVKLDVGEAEHWGRAITEVVSALGGIDIAYLNAGVTTPEASIANVPDGSYRRIMRANVDGVFFGVRAVTPVIERRGGGGSSPTRRIRSTP